MIYLTDVITEANARIANSFTNTDYALWLNEANNEFFDIVKIPISEPFTTYPEVATVMLTNNMIREKNVDRVMVGTSIYNSFNYESVQPGTNYFIFDEPTKVLTLFPAPLLGGAGIIRFHKIATSTYTAASLSSSTPDAPPEYHWIYSLMLAERIAKAMDDEVKVNNLAGDVRKNLLIAQQNFAKG